MKKFIAVLTMLSVSFPVFAQQSEERFFITKQPCVPVLEAIQIAREYGELLLFTGNAVTYDTNDMPYTSGGFLFVNQDTGTWSIVNVYADGMACLVNAGSDFEPYSGPQE